MVGDKEVGGDLPTIADDLVVTKYKMAAEIVNKVLKEICDGCKPGTSVREMCMLGDSRLVEETSKAFKKDKKLVKGIAFPTCISANNCICHFSPLTTEPDVTIADGAMVAAHLASEAALRLVKPGNETYEVTETVSKIGEAFDCKPVEGMLSHQLEQNRIDGEKTIIQNPSEAQRKE